MPDETPSPAKRTRKRSTRKAAPDLVGRDGARPGPGSGAGRPSTPTGERGPRTADRPPREAGDRDASQDAAPAVATDPPETVRLRRGPADGADLPDTVLRVERGGIGEATAGSVEVHVGGIGALEAEEVFVEWGGVGAARADRLSVEFGSVGAALAGEMRLTQGFAGRGRRARGDASSRASCGR